MGKKNLAVIPARSGSKGLPDKNIKLLSGKPLLAYSVEAALQSKAFTEIMVSTDSEKYASIARQAGANVPFLRSEANSLDNASSWDAVREILENYALIGQHFDTVCLLQPTSPLRTDKDIINAYKIYDEKNASAVIGVCKTEHSPLWENTLPNSMSMDNFISDAALCPRQHLEQYYRINGAIYIVDSQRIKNKENIYSNSFAYVMETNRSVDIDNMFDFYLAECILNYND